jgi:hypothetical protein
MDILDRYLGAVRSYLPKSLSLAQQDDIIAELEENLRAQMDDREAELGHPLSGDEENAILQRHGHPMLVAGRYQVNQGRVAFGRELIGPALFPVYLRTLWIVMAISLGIYAVVVTVLALTDNPLTAGGVLTSVVVQAAIQFVALTAIFTVANQYLPTMRWDARTLPAPRPQSLERQGERVSRLESLAEIVGIVVMVGWLWFAYNQPFLLFGPALENYRLAPVWQQAALPTLLVLGVSVARAVVNLFRPEWVRLKRVVSVLADIAALGIVLFLLQADTWVTLANGAAAPGSANEFVYYGLLITSAGFVVGIAVDAWKLIRGEMRQRRQQTQQHRAA